MKTFITIFILALSTNAFAQITQIPDPNFEQALIDLDIDSDGIVNGQVLTSDIETVISLNVENKGIQDLTGLEDFIALEDLNVSNNLFNSLILTSNTNLKTLIVNTNFNLFTLNVSNNFLLEYLYCSLSTISELNLTNNIMLKELVLGDDLPSGTNIIEHLDLSNNLALEKLHLINMDFLKTINLKNGNNISLADVIIYCELDFGAVCEPFPCMEVDDIVAAQNNQFPYSEWSVAVNYAEDCTLGVSTQVNLIISIHPNPAKNELFITAQNTTENLKIKTFNIEGKLLSAQSITLQDQKAIDVSQLLNGIYFLNIEGEKGNTTIKKFIKQ